MLAQTPLQSWIAAKVGCLPEALTHTAISNYQFEKIRQTITLVEQNGRFYQKKFSGLNTTEINCQADLERIPFTDADELRRFGLQMLCVSQSEINRVVTLDTSGTSGPAKRCFFTKDDQNLTIDFFGIGMSCLVSDMDRVLILLPGQSTGSVGDLLAAGLQSCGIFALKYGPVRDVEDVLRVIHNEKITSLVGVPSQVLAMVRWANILKLSLPTTIRSVLLSTDHVPTAVIKAIEHAWSCKVFNHYGMTEMGLGGGVDCQAHTGYHLREADLYFEIIDPVSGKVLPDGEMGEVVFTTLTRRGMPLIRYRTGDISRFLPAACPCGTVLKTMQPVRYRSRDILQFDHGFLTLADLDEVLFGLEAVLDFKAAIHNHSIPVRLDLQLFACYLDMVEKQVYQALEALPVLQGALQDGSIRIDIQLKYGLPDHFGSLAKRKFLTIE
jgi:phenylacetate-coenzyme A ligase PaaK-like adenylate-forming protein